jgi:hypothetical protein
MPVEKLIQSMQPEQPLIVDSSSGGGYGSSQSGATSGASMGPAAPQ